MSYLDFSGSTFACRILDAAGPANGSVKPIYQTLAHVLTAVVASAYHNVGINGQRLWRARGLHSMVGVVTDSMDGHFVVFFRLVFFEF